MSSVHERATYCRICEAACGLIATVDGSEVIALRPDRDHVVSRGFACAKGTRFAAIHDDPDRLNHAFVRRAGKLERAPVGAVLRDAGDRIRELRERYGPHAVGVYVGNPAAFSTLTPVLAMAFVRGLGTRNYFNAGSLDCNNKFVVSRAVLGSPALHPVPDLDRAACALLVGTNPSVSQSSFVNAPRMVERLGALERRGGRVFVIDPRRTETARMVGEHVAIRPDTDAAFLLALLHVAFDEGLEDARTLRRHANGESELRTAVLAFAPERVAPFCGVSADVIRRIARTFATANGSFCHVSTGVNQGTFGNIAYAAKLALELCTGNLDSPGGALMQRGAVDAAGWAHRFGFDREPAHRSRVGGFAPVLGALPSAILADEIEQPGDGQIRALVVLAGNPLLSMPGGERLRRALASLDALVSIDLYANDTAAFATHLLPSTDWLEREDLPLAQVQLQPEPYLQLAEPVVAPQHERRHDWHHLLDLSAAAGIRLGGSGSSDRVLRTALAAGGPRALLAPALVPALGPRPFARLQRAPHGLRVDREKRDFLRRRVLTPSGRVELFPAEVWVRLGELEARMRDADHEHLLLVTKRERLGHNSWLHNHARLGADHQCAYVHPDDAERLGLEQGDSIRLSAVRPDGQALELPVAVSADVVPGSVAVPHGYGHEPGAGWRRAAALPGANVNALADTGPGAVDRLSGMCRFVGVPVRAERAAGAVRETAE